MIKLCKQCNKEIKGKPKIYDNYYFCNNDLCLKYFLDCLPEAVKLPVLTVKNKMKKLQEQIIDACKECGHINGFHLDGCSMTSFNEKEIEMLDDDIIVVGK